MQTKHLLLTSLVVLILSAVTMAAILVADESNADTSGSWTYTVSGGNATLTAYSGTEANITIPNTLNGTPVTAIGASVFMGNNTIRSVVIPDNIISIGNDAFRNSSIVSVTIQGNPTLGTYIFRNCQSLNDFDFGTEIQVLGTGMFNSDEALLTVEIPNSVTTILGSFNYCKNLSGVIIPSSVTTLSGNAFTNTAISSIVIPSSVTTISNMAFNQCRNLVDVWVHYALDVPVGTFNSSNAGLVITQYAVVTLDGQSYNIPTGSVLDPLQFGDTWYFENGDPFNVDAPITADITLVTDSSVVDPEDPEPLDPIITDYTFDLYSPDEYFNVDIFKTFSFVIPSDEEFISLSVTGDYVFARYSPVNHVIYGVSTSAYDPSAVLTVETSAGIITREVMSGNTIIPPALYETTDFTLYLDQWFLFLYPGADIVFNTQPPSWINQSSPSRSSQAIELGDFTIEYYSSSMMSSNSSITLHVVPVPTFSDFFSDALFEDNPLIPVDPTDPDGATNSKDSKILWILIGITVFFGIVMALSKNPYIAFLTVILAAVTIGYYIWG